MSGVYSATAALITHGKIPGQEQEFLIKCSYHEGLVWELKARVPVSHRMWSPEVKTWRVAPAYLPVVKDLVRKHLGVELKIATLQTAGDVGLVYPQEDLQPTDVVIRLEHLRQYGFTGDVFFGYVNHKPEDSYTFPGYVLYNWFRFNEPDLNLYAVLKVSGDATTSEIARVYGSLALAWHPEFNPDPQAAHNYQCIQHAYEVLSNPERRANYDLEQQLRVSLGMTRQWPLCGILYVTVLRETVQRILSWGNLYDTQGRKLKSIWDNENQTYSLLPV